MPIKPNSALIVVDLQNDFLPPTGSLAVKGGRDIIVPIIDLLDTDKYPWKAIVATRDFHPQDHYSFASNWGQEPFTPRNFEHPLLEKDPESGETLKKEQVLWPDHCVQGKEGSEFTPEFAKAFQELLSSSSSTGKDNVAEVKKGYLTDREYYSAFEDTWGIHKTELNQFLKKQKIENIYLVGLAYDFCVLNTAASGSELGYGTHVLKDLSRSVYADKLDETEEAYILNNIHIISSKEIA